MRYVLSAHCTSTGWAQDDAARVKQSIHRFLSLTTEYLQHSDDLNMSTLLDELREDLGDSDSDENDQQEASSPESSAHEDADEPDEPAPRTVDSAQDSKIVSDADKLPNGNYINVLIHELKTAYKLLRELKTLVDQINHYQSLPPSARSTDLLASKDNLEYELLTTANSSSSSVDSEMLRCHKFIKDHYSTRFPELETLVTNPLAYAKTVDILGNGPFDDIRSFTISTPDRDFSLKTVLDAPTLMVVAVEANGTRGHLLTDTELLRIREACKLMTSLDQAKRKMTEYVQSRMAVFAPNLTQLCGSLVAAQLLNARGGLREFAETHPGNLPSLGAKNQAAAGLATNVGFQKQGFLYQCPILIGVPQDLKPKAVKKLGNKAHRAALIDLAREHTDGSDGIALREQVLQDLEKSTRPPPNQGVRALPAPDDKPTRKRGGRAARIAKKATAMTEIRTLQNRMAFGKEEKEVGYGMGEGTKGMGMVGMQNDGRIRAVQADPRTKVKLSKKLQGRLDSNSSARSSGIESVLGGTSMVSRETLGLRSSGVNQSEGDISGMQSSLSFTPLHGIELVDPLKREAQKRKRKAEEDRWFSSGTFTMVGNNAHVDSGGFKIPQAPPRKKQNTG